MLDLIPGSHWYCDGKVLTIMLVGKDKDGNIGYAVKESNMNVSDPYKYTIIVYSENEMRQKKTKLKPMRGY